MAKKHCIFSNYNRFSGSKKKKVAAYFKSFSSQLFKAKVSSNLQGMAKNLIQILSYHSSSLSSFIQEKILAEAATLHS